MSNLLFGKRKSSRIEPLGQDFFLNTASLNANLDEFREGIQSLNAASRKASYALIRCWRLMAAEYGEFTFYDKEYLHWWTIKSQTDVVAEAFSTKKPKRYYTLDNKDLGHMPMSALFVTDVGHLVRGTVKHILGNKELAIFNKDNHYHYHELGPLNLRECTELLDDYLPRPICP